MTEQSFVSQSDLSAIDITPRRYRNQQCSSTTDLRKAIDISTPLKLSMSNTVEIEVLPEKAVPKQDYNEVFLNLDTLNPNGDINLY